MLRVSETACEYQIDPLGIDSRKPRLFWKTESDGETQSWYRVIVASSEAELRGGRGDLYDTGAVFSS